MKQIRPGIVGLGLALPPKILTNDDLAKFVDTNDEWITTRTGIKERRLLKGEGLGAATGGAGRVFRENTNGGIVKKEGSIHISNLMYVEGGKTVRLGRKLNET